VIPVSRDRPWAGWRIGPDSSSDPYPSQFSNDAPVADGTAAELWRAGEKLFVDHAGDTVACGDRKRVAARDPCCVSHGYTPIRHTCRPQKPLDGA